ncbi:MAG: hypothetical protein RL095_1766 [Verrucomicrobiota bacterium]|jgi:hypothetical protein
MPKNSKKNLFQVTLRHPAVSTTIKLKTDDRLAGIISDPRTLI